MKIKVLSKIVIAVFFALLLTGIQSCSFDQTGSDGQLYNLGTELESRSISFENPTGSKGEGGKTESNLGVGRKGSPAKSFAPGETVVLCDIKGPGTIRHIWMAGSFKDKTTALRSMVIRAYWEDQKHPGIECPLGDFMGFAHGKVNSYQSAVHSIGKNAALNIWLPMPFKKKGKVTLTNEGDAPVTVYYQIDYTIGDNHPEKLGRLHVCFLRDNPTALKQDFEILPKRSGAGCYIGTVLGIRTLEDNWWGEGEIKIYIDGDTTFPTICGTGSEDYVCLSYGMQQTPFLYHGCSLNQDGYVSMYRWHLPDPVYWKNECRITIQQIGWSREHKEKTGHALFERQDDWCSATFWYEPIPSAPLPSFPGLKDRIADLDE